MSPKITRRLLKALKRTRAKSTRALFVRNGLLYGEQAYDAEISYSRSLLRQLVSHYGAADTYRLIRNEDAASPPISRICALSYARSVCALAEAEVRVAS